MAFPNSSLLDAFTRADAASLGASWGIDVEANYPSLAIVTNRAQQAAVFKSNYWLTQFGADQEVWATIVALQSAAFMRLILRGQNLGPTATFYYLTIDYNGACYLDKQIAGSSSNLSTIGGAGFVAAGNKMGVQVVGSTLKVFKDTGGGFAQVGVDVTDATITGAGYIGMMIGNGTGGTLDDFGGGTYTTVTLDDCLPDADVTTTGWSTAPLFSKVNDVSDATVITATAV